MIKIGDKSVIDGIEQVCRVISKDYKNNSKIIVCESRARIPEKDWINALKTEQIPETEHVQDVETQIDDIKKEYESVLGVSVPKNKSNDPAWLIQKILEKKAESSTEDNE